MRARTNTGLVLLLAVGCASEPTTPEQDVRERLDKFSELIDEKIEDPVRADELKQVMQNLSSEFDRRAKVIQDRQAELKAAARRYETTDAELEQILSDLRGETVALRQTLQDGHFDLRDRVSEEEWQEVVNPRSKFLGIF